MIERILCLNIYNCWTAPSHFPSICRTDKEGTVPIAKHCFPNFFGIHIFVQNKPSLQTPQLMSFPVISMVAWQVTIVRSKSVGSLAIIIDIFKHNCSIGVFSKTQVRCWRVWQHHHRISPSGKLDIQSQVKGNVTKNDVNHRKLWWCLTIATMAKHKDYQRKEEKIDVGQQFPHNTSIFLKLILKTWKGPLKPCWGHHKELLWTFELWCVVGTVGYSCHASHSSSQTQYKDNPLKLNRHKWILAILTPRNTILSLTPINERRYFCYWIRCLFVAFNSDSQPDTNDEVSATIPGKNRLKGMKLRWIVDFFRDPELG